MYPAGAWGGGERDRGTEKAKRAPRERERVRFPFRKGESKEAKSKREIKIHTARRPPFKSP